MFMTTPEQMRAAYALERAMRICAERGLQGAVFEGTIMVWPTDLKPHPQDDPRGFEASVKDGGHILSSHGMNWDGATA